MAVHVINEARRCLQCKKPLCRIKGCPVQTNVPEMIRLFLDGKINEAGAMLYDNNPMSVFCSLVCDHDAQCEGNCIQGRRGAPIQISSIEHYISDTYLDKLVLTRKSYNGHNVAVIGAGPAGIVVAVKLAQEGYGVTIFERMQQIGGMLRYGIPAYRFPRERLDEPPSTIDRYGEKLRTLGIHIRPNTTIGSALRVDDLFRDGYEAIFMGTGAWRAKALKIPGETLGNCHYAVNYLQNPDVYHLGDRVAVIGSGNSAMDVARTAIRKGSRYVTIYARRNGISASERELEYALMDGCEIEYAKGIHSVTPEGPMMYDRVFDEEQNLISEGAPYLIPADSTVIAASQGVKDKIVRTTKGVTLNEKGLVKIDENGMTERDGVFAAGDVVLGPWNVVQVVKDAKHVADAMIRYLEARSAAV